MTMIKKQSFMVAKPFNEGKTGADKKSIRKSGKQEYIEIVKSCFLFFYLSFFLTSTPGPLDLRYSLEELSPRHLDVSRDFSFESRGLVEKKNPNNIVNVNSLHKWKVRQNSDQPDFPTVVRNPLESIFKIFILLCTFLL